MPTVQKSKQSKLEYNKKWLQLRRATLLAKGLCVRCGNSPPRLGRQTCECVTAYDAARKAKLRSEGRCVDCAAPIGILGTDRCAECSSYYSKRQKRRKKERKEKGMCPQCGKNPPSKGHRWCPECRTATREYDAKVRGEVLAHYGAVCECCKESEPAFLTFDHINGGGTKHRKETGRGKLHQWLRRHNYPQGYRVLCFNCNCGRAVNGGICPHLKVQSV